MKANKIRILSYQRNPTSPSRALCEECGDAFLETTAANHCRGGWAETTPQEIRDLFYENALCIHLRAIIYPLPLAGT